MPVMRRRTKDATMPTPCDRLAQALAQLDAAMSGQQVRVIETPQLGRVEFADAKVADLQRLIYTLQVQCAEYMGANTYGMRRRPISMEAEP